MLKAKEYKVEDSNVALLGSDLDKKCRVAAAQTEQAWKDAGKQVGMQIWRIEKFNVKTWPKDQYGSFYDGDSYICLNTYKEKDSPKLRWDVHFWLGKFTSQDEAGTAAYKTVELDDLLGGDPVQHREVQGFESELFLGYFKNEIKLLSGGVDSGFKKVGPKEYKPKLLWVKGTKKFVRVTEVEMKVDSLNSGDVFILDCGLDIFQFNGAGAGPQEKMKGAQVCRGLNDDRSGKAAVHVFEEGASGDEHFKTFMTKLGGKVGDKIKSASEGGSDDLKPGPKILFHLSDASGKLEFKKVGEGSAINKKLLQSDDCHILDCGNEIIVWVGKGANKTERSKALGFAQTYLADSGKPAFTPISKCNEGAESKSWQEVFG